MPDVFLCLLRRTCIALLGSVAVTAQATDLARIPLQTQGLAKPNVVFGMDDSGSMDFETLFSTQDGEMWWDRSTGSAYLNKVLIKDAGSNTNPDYGYLFPNGYTSSTGGQRHYSDSNGVLAIPPTPQFAFARSARFNPIYYNSATTYLPWGPATIGGVAKTFANANPKAALSHPMFATPTMDLTALQNNSGSNFTFRLHGGMVAPKGSTLKASSKTSGACNGSSTFTLDVDLVVSSSLNCDAAIPYRPASFWNAETCTVNGTTCVTSPDATTTLKYYDITTSSSFPSGRTQADELQNFANWFTYYRKRVLMLGSSMSTVMQSLTAMRVGVVGFNNLAPPTMFDTDTADNTLNGQAVTGLFYSNPAYNGTPTRETLKYIGNQFMTNKAIIQYSCQRNAAFLVTDGFVTIPGSAVLPPTYDMTVFGNKAPYTKTWGVKDGSSVSSLADLALGYYTTNLRTDLPAGRVSVPTGSGVTVSSDTNANLHMNTYAITLGASGSIWPANSNAYANPPTWTNPTATQSPSSIDDLWHGTLNGRGKMFKATNPKETADATQSALTEILNLAGSQTGVAFSTVNLRSTEALAYAGLYRPQGWSGDVGSFNVSLSDGSLVLPPIWSADVQLNATDWTTRKLVSFNGSSAVSFNATDVGALVNPSGAYGTTTTLMNYLQGDRSNESTVYRLRTGLMGAVVNAEPVASRMEDVVFASTNEGMLHALDKDTGNELWAYVPGLVLDQIGAQSQKSWAFKTLLDGTPVITNIDQRNILVAGLGTAGSGYFALDVTGAKTFTTAALKASVLWEFPSASTPAAVKAQLGASVGKPVVVNTSQYGWVVLVTSGYNPAGDKLGRLFVLDARSGALKATLSTPTPSGTSTGLAQISGFLKSDGTVRFVYGGDELGKLWRFDLDKGTVSQLASLTDASGAALPITAAPELAILSGRPMVFVGTGRLLGLTDFDDTRVNSFFAIWDKEYAATGIQRSNLAVNTLKVSSSVATDQVILKGATIDWTQQKGWYVDMPAGQKAHTDPSIAFGVLAWTTNTPSLTSCSSTSQLYIANALDGNQVEGTAFVSGALSASIPAYYSTQLAFSLTSKAVVARLPDGRLVVTTRMADNTTRAQLLMNKGKVLPHRTGWRQVFK